MPHPGSKEASALRGGACKYGQTGHRQQILPWRGRILGLMACEDSWPHRKRFPASFLW